MKILIVVVSLFLFWGNADARCVCRCVDGQVRALCTSSLDIRPVCAPRVCPIVTPSVKPIDSIRLPPLGTTTCTNKQVWTGTRYEWREVCR